MKYLLSAPISGRRSYPAAAGCSLQRSPGSFPYRSRGCSARFVPTIASSFPSDEIILKHIFLLLIRAVAAAVSVGNLADADDAALKLCKQSLIILPPVAPRQPPGAHRPLPMVGSGVPAAATFFESLADADAAALKRLIRLD